MRIHILLFLCIHYIHSELEETPEPPTTMDTIPTEATTDPSSEFIFSPEKHYINDDEIEQMKAFDTRPFHIPPFYSQERDMHTEPPPKVRRLKKVKKFFRKILFLDYFTTPRLPENATHKPEWFERLYHFVKYTILKRVPPVTEHVTLDPEFYFFSKHYTDWKYFNNLYFEVINSTNMEAHWWYREIMKHRGVDLADISTTTPLPFDIHRMDGFSTNLTLPPTVTFDENEDYNTENMPEWMKQFTLRPAFAKALDDYAKHVTFPTIPDMEIGKNSTYFFESERYKRIQNKLISFYWITTRNPDQWMDEHEKYRNAKLGRWLARKEKEVLASVERDMQGYAPDFGPEGNSFYAYICNFTTPKSLLQEILKREKEAEMGTTISKDKKQEEEDKLFVNVPVNIREAINRGQQLNVSILENFLYRHCKNISVPWETVTPIRITKLNKTLAPKLTRTYKTEIITKELTIPIQYRKILEDENFTLTREKIDRAFVNAQIHMRNLSFFRIEKNWNEVSKLMWEDQFTTPATELNSSEVKVMFTHVYPDLLEQN